MERAKGNLQRDLQLSEEEAYLTLQRQSRQRRKPLREVAEVIVLFDEIKRAQTMPASTKPAQDSTPLGLRTLCLIPHDHRISPPTWFFSSAFVAAASRLP
jgi:hypothetical protein